MYIDIIWIVYNFNVLWIKLHNVTGYSDKKQIYTGVLGRY